jgi:histidinol-phosphate aminotransferase
MRPLPAAFAEYRWAPSTEEIAREFELPVAEVRRFDGNVPPTPTPAARPEAVAGALAGVNEYAHGGFPVLVEAIAEYAGVEPENVVLGAGADDLILLCARSFAGPGDAVAIDPEPTYPLFRIAAHLAGAEATGSASPVVTFTCRPNNPTGTQGALPSARPLVVDEAYFEFAGETAAHLLDDGVVVLRTFSKAFGLAGGRVGYALAAADVAAELNRRQAPMPISGISAALALAALEQGPEVTAHVAERERCATALAELGFEPPTSRTNFLFVPVRESEALGAALLRQGLVVRVFPDGIRFSVRDRADDDRLLDALAAAISDEISPAARSTH